ncbi:MAG: LysR family transcriptional regulator [Caldimonas sp.]
MNKIHAVNKGPDLSSLDLNLLVVFDAIFKDRNITVAARRVGLSQPAMSSALARLRKAFGDPLFVRTSNGMQPTPHAQLLATPIQRACELVVSALEIDSAFDPLTATCTYRFYMTDIGEAVYLPRLLGALAQRAPGVKIKVLRVPEQGAQEAMAAGDVDLAVGFFLELQAGFFQQRLYSDEFVCLLRADHPQARTRLSVEQFASMHHAVVATAGTGHEATIGRAVAKHRLKVSLTLPHFMALPLLVSQTDYVVTVPRRLALVFASYGNLKIIESPIKIPSFEIKQHWHERYHHDPASRWMRALVAELFLQ